MAYFQEKLHTIWRTDILDFADMRGKAIMFTKSRYPIAEASISRTIVISVHMIVSSLTCAKQAGNNAKL